MLDEKHYIYFLVSKDKSAFKIGVSINTAQRMKQLGGDFDLEKSFYIECEEAFVVEKILHRVFRKNNITLPHKDGYTEWFDFSCFDSVVVFINKNKDHLVWTELFKINIAEKKAADGRVHLSGEALKARKAENIKIKQEKQISFENINRSNAIFFRCMCKKMVLSGALIGKFKDKTYWILVFRKNLIPESTHNLIAMLIFSWCHAGISLCDGEVYYGSNKYRFIRFRGEEGNEKYFDKFGSVQIYLSTIKEIPTTSTSELLSDILKKVNRLIRLKKYVHEKKQLLLEKKAAFKKISPLCPRCGSEMILRKNNRTKQKFLGCLKYPACKGTITFNKNEMGAV